MLRQFTLHFNGPNSTLARKHPHGPLARGPSKDGVHCAYLMNTAHSARTCNPSSWSYVQAPPFKDPFADGLRLFIHSSDKEAAPALVLIV